MYLDEISSFINLRDIQSMSVSSEGNIFIKYLQGSDTTITIKDKKYALMLMGKISKRAEIVQRGDN